MSRIGRMPIAIPANVTVTIDEAAHVITVKGPKGTLTENYHSLITVKVEGNEVLVERHADDNLNKALHGTTRANVFNIIEGVTNGFTKVLEINGLGYRASVAGTKLNLELGFSHPVNMDIPTGLTVTVDPKSGSVAIKGSNKFLVGDFAAKIRRIRPPEPYKGSGIKYQGEHIARKAGKTAAGGK